jgi:hypothetical protein
MKFFFLFFAALTILCGCYWVADGPDSGMEYATPFFALIALGVGIYNWRKNGSPLSEGPPKA